MHKVEHQFTVGNKVYYTKVEKIFPKEKCRLCGGNRYLTRPMEKNLLECPECAGQGERSYHDTTVIDTVVKCSMVIRVNITIEYHHQGDVMTEIEYELGDGEWCGYEGDLFATEEEARKSIRSYKP